MENRMISKQNKWSIIISYYIVIFLPVIIYVYYVFIYLYVCMYLSISTYIHIYICIYISIAISTSIPVLFSSLSGAHHGGCCKVLPFLAVDWNAKWMMKKYQKSRERWTPWSLISISSWVWLLTWQLSSEAELGLSLWGQQDRERGPERAGQRGHGESNTVELPQKMGPGALCWIYPWHPILWNPDGEASVKVSS